MSAEAVAWAVAASLMQPVTAVHAPGPPPEPNEIAGVVVTARPSTPVEEVDVIGGKHCIVPARTGASLEAKVISTYPAYGHIVPAGPTLLRLTFDIEMSPCKVGLVALGPFEPEFIKSTVMMSPDRRTFWFAIDLVSGRDFHLEINPHLYPDFRSRSGGYALPYTILFRSSIESRSSTILGAAKLDPEFVKLNAMRGDVIRLGVPVREPLRFKP